MRSTVAGGGGVRQRTAIEKFDLATRTKGMRIDTENEDVRTAQRTIDILHGVMTLAQGTNTETGPHGDMTDATAQNGNRLRMRMYKFIIKEAGHCPHKPQPSPAKRMAAQPLSARKINQKLKSNNQTLSPPVS
jgi:hypothetical protein